MEFRLFPNPSKGVCTPYQLIGDTHYIYARYFIADSTNKLITISINEHCNKIEVHGNDFEEILGDKSPDREIILDILGKDKYVNKNLLSYIKNTCVVPTFPLTFVEAIIKTFIRQIISAKQAKRLFSDFVKEFGYEDQGIFNFPSIEQIKDVQLSDFEYLGLGLKAKRIFNAIREIGEIKDLAVKKIKGVGPWSEEIMNVEISKNYSFYPFWDKSGEKILNKCGINLLEIAKRNKEIAGSIYVYSASYLESLR